MKPFIYVSFLLIDIFIFAAGQGPYQLELVQALFRHGDRIPEKVEVYKTDPYNPEYYEPTGYGQLTKVGMQRAYQVGQVLRKLYDNFLGEFKYDKVYAYSTDSDRTKVSLQLVLAGLFPPTNSSAWNANLLWTPIPTKYKPVNSDFLLGPILGSCANSSKLQQGLKHPEIQESLAKYKDFVDYVRNKTEQIGDSSILKVVLIANNLRAIRSMDLKLPSWCSEQDYKKLSEISAIMWKVLTITPELRKQLAGPMIKRFLENMKKHKKKDKRKIYLYSAHDINVAPFTGAHNFTGIPATPDFGSTVIIEKLRGSDNESYVRMLLWTGAGQELILLKLENCSEECPLSEYEKIVAPLLPDPKLEKCLSGHIFRSKRSNRKDEFFYIHS